MRLLLMRCHSWHGIACAAFAFALMMVTILCHRLGTARVFCRCHVALLSSGCGHSPECAVVSFALSFHSACPRVSSLWRISCGGLPFLPGSLAWWRMACASAEEPRRGLLSLWPSWRRILARGAVSASRDGAWRGEGRDARGLPSRGSSVEFLLGGRVFARLLAYFGRIG